uniref:Integrin subunit alpha 2b n=1 Tax=Strix occidentalis caurina TaxID=311401 RepID=A0A8D0FUI5_STROC
SPPPPRRVPGGTATPYPCPALPAGPGISTPQPKAARPPLHPSSPLAPCVVVGAPHANTSQPGVAQPGAVFLCSWPLNDPPCQPLLIDTTGNTLNLHTYKSHQWLGASVTSWDGKLACAPLQHWNAMDSQHEAFRTPTGACFVGAPGLRRVAWYSPCRDQLMASTYRESYYGEGRRVGGGSGCPPPLAGLTLPCARS